MLKECHLISIFGETDDFCKELDKNMPQPLLHEQLKTYATQVNYYDKKINNHAVTDSRCVMVQEIEGVGPITASAIVATIGDANVFKNGRVIC